MLYHIDITNGVINYEFNNAEDANIKKYFAVIGKTKPKPTRVRGWPFDNIYLWHGTLENGLAIAVKPKKSPYY